MPINHVDGQYSLDIHERKFQTEYSDNVDELRDRAEKLIAAGRFQYLLLYRWNADTQNWDYISEFEPE